MQTRPDELLLRALVYKHSVRTLATRTGLAFHGISRPEHWLLEGALRGKGARMRVAFRGRRALLSDIEGLFFGRCNKTPNSGSPRAVEAELWVHEALPWATSTGSTYVVQSWFDSVCAPESAEQHLARHVSESIRRKLRRATKAGFGWIESRRREDGERFYQELFEPMAQARFGELASYGNFGAFWDNNGRTMHTDVAFLKCDGEVIAGSGFVVSPPRRLVRLWAYGMKTPLLDQPETRADVMALLNLHALRKVVALQSILNLGRTRPYTDDGVHIYKSRWGTTLVPIEEARLALRFSSPEVQTLFLREAPLWHIGPDGTAPIPVPEDASARALGVMPDRTGT